VDAIFLPISCGDVISKEYGGCGSSNQSGATKIHKCFLVLLRCEDIDDRKRTINSSSFFKTVKTVVFMCELFTRRNSW